MLVDSKEIFYYPGALRKIKFFFNKALNRKKINNLHKRQFEKLFNLKLLSMKI